MDIKNVVKFIGTMTYFSMRMLSLARCALPDQVSTIFLVSRAVPVNGCSVLGSHIFNSRCRRHFQVVLGRT